MNPNVSWCPDISFFCCFGVEIVFIEATLFNIAIIILIYDEIPVKFNLDTPEPNLVNCANWLVKAYYDYYYSVLIYYIISFTKVNHITCSLCVQ